MNCTKIRYEFTGRKDGYVIVTAIFEYDSKYLVEYPVAFIDDGRDDLYYFKRAKALVWDQAKTGYLDTIAFRLTEEVRMAELGRETIKVEEEKETKRKIYPILWWLNQKIWVRAAVYSLLSIGLALSLTLPLIKSNNGSAAGGGGGGSDPGYSVYGASVSDPTLTPAEAAAITMTDAEAVEGEAFNTTVNIDNSVITNKVLPAKLDHVWTSGASSSRKRFNVMKDAPIINGDVDIVDQCEYIVSEDLIHADIRVPAEYVNGDIRVEMALSASEQVTLKINTSDESKGWFIADPSQPGVKTYELTGVTTRENEAPASPSVFHLNEDLPEKRYECVWEKDESNDDDVYVAKFAEFPREYTVTFDPGEGSFKPGEEDKAFQVVKYNDTIPEIPELNEPVSSDSRYTSYSHAWYTDKEFTEKFLENTPVTSNLNLYAKWVYKKDYVELTALEDDDVFTFTVGSGANYAIEASYNARDWEPQTSPFVSTSVNAGEKVYIRVKPASAGDVTVTSVHIDSTKTFNAGGNIMSLIDYTKDLTELGSSEFSYLFGAPTGTGSPVVDASELILPATTVTESAYNGMFRSCKKLTDAPDLDSMVTVEKMGCGAMFYECSSLANGPTTLGATTVGNLGYSNMFTDCSKLVKAPEIAVTTLGTESGSGGNCSSMFLRCTELTTAPSILKPTTLTPDCYNAMFGHCEKLTTAPKIMATTYDANSCVKMFGNCYALTNVPDLEATTLGYNSCWMMFQQCNLLQKAPYLPATTLSQGCYYQMFEDCSALNEIKIAYDGDLPAANNATKEWLKNVAATGTIYYNGSSTTPSLDGSGIPYDWTIQPFSN